MVVVADGGEVEHLGAAADGVAGEVDVHASGHAAGGGGAAKDNRR